MKRAEPKTLLNTDSYTKSHYRVLGFVLLLFLIISPFALLNFNTAEDGIWLKPAVDFARGKVLFRDTMSPYGILTVIIQGFTVKLFGEFLYPLRLQAACIYACTAVLMFFIWKKYMSENLSLASVLLWIALAPFFHYMLNPWSSIYALIPQAFTLLFLIYFIEKGKNLFLYVAGATSMLTLLIRQPVGVFLTGAVILFLAIYGVLKKNPPQYRIRHFLLYFGGVASAFLPFFLYLVFNSALKDWWIQSFLFAHEYAKAIRGVAVEQILKSLLLGRYFKMGEYPRMILWLIIPFTSFYLLLKPLWSAVRKERLTVYSYKLLLAGLVCCASWMQYYPMTEPVHFFWSVSPIVGFFMLFLNEIFFIHRRKASVLFFRLLTVFLILIIFMQIGLNIIRFKNAPDYPKSFPFLKYIRISSYERLALEGFRNKLTKFMVQNDTYINIADDFGISFIDPRFHQIDPLHGIWSYFSEPLYPLYYKKVNSYINSTRPVIVTRVLPYISNYCSLKNVPYTHPYMGIHIPIEKLFDADLSDKNLHLSFKKNTSITAIRRLEDRLNRFSVFNPHKVRTSSLSVETQISFPIRKNRGETVEIPLKAAAPFIIINLADPDVESCTFSVNNELFGP